MSQWMFLHPEWFVAMQINCSKENELWLKLCKVSNVKPESDPILGLSWSNWFTSTSPFLSTRNPGQVHCIVPGHYYYESSFSLWHKSGIPQWNQGKVWLGSFLKPADGWFFIESVSMLWIFLDLKQRPKKRVVFSEFHFEVLGLFIISCPKWNTRSEKPDLVSWNWTKCSHELDVKEATEQPASFRETWPCNLLPTAESGFPRSTEALEVDCTTGAPWPNLSHIFFVLLPLTMCILGVLQAPKPDLNSCVLVTGCREKCSTNIKEFVIFPSVSSYLNNFPDKDTGISFGSSWMLMGTRGYLSCSKETKHKERIISTDIFNASFKVSQGTFGKTISQTLFLGVPALSQEHLCRRFSSESDAVHVQF